MRGNRATGDPAIDEFLGLDTDLDAAKVWVFVTRHERDGEPRGRVPLTLR